MDVIFFFNTSRSYWVVSCRAGWPAESVFCRLCSRLLYVVAKPQVSVDTPCHYTIVLFGIASRFAILPGCGLEKLVLARSFVRLAQSLSLCFSRLSPLKFRRFRRDDTLASRWLGESTGAMMWVIIFWLHCSLWLVVPSLCTTRAVCSASLCSAQFCAALRCIAHLVQ